MNKQATSRVLARARVTARVEAMLAFVEQRDQRLPERLRNDAFSEMVRWKSIVVKSLDESPATDCSIAAIYLPDATPPEIGVFASLSRARTNFSALHEFGHHLQMIIPGMVDELGDQPDRGRALEEMTCDAFAARIVLPSDLVRRHLGPGTPTAVQVAALHANSTASRAAVCVAAAQQLESPGHIILLDDYGIVDFSASHIELPLPRGRAQVDSAVMKALADSRRAAVDEVSRFTYRNGTQGPPLYAQATSMSGYTVIVAVSDKAPWKNLSLTSTDERLKLRWHTCERCEHDFTYTTRCELCGQPKCPECDWCDCKKQKERRCDDCGMVKSINLFDGGGAICRDCT